MSVVLTRTVRLRIGAGSAKPGPAIGQALGPLGLNMAEFCKQFNDQTKDFEKDVPVPVTLAAYSNRTFKFAIKTPPTTWFLKKCAGIKKGATKPGHDSVGQIHVKQIYEIALMKMRDPHMSELPHESVAKSIAASAASMGLQIVKD